MGGQTWCRGWAGSRWVACWGGPELGTEGPLLLRPAGPGPQGRPLPRSFEKCRLDRAAPGPGLAFLGVGLCHGDRREAGTHGSDRRGGWAGAGVPKQEEQAGIIQTLLAGTALATVTHSRPREAPGSGHRKTRGYSLDCCCVTWGR